MTVEVKICGLTTAPTMDAALEAGADYVGLVFYPPSPRNVSVSEAEALAERARGRSKIVALFVDPNDQILDEVIARINPDVIQLHGAETPERILNIRQRTNASIMKAVKVATAEDVAEAASYGDTADIILFDAKAPKLSADSGDVSLPGGNGERFDWRLLEARKNTQPWMLSGGLNPDTIAAAIQQTGATAVDVSSGVEHLKGEKSVELISAFVAAARLAENSGATARPDQGVGTHVEA